MSDHPLVSIVVRTTGRAELEHALESIRTQRYRPLEVIVVNAAQARLQANLRPLEEADDITVRLIEARDNLRRSKAANVGLEACHGDLVMLLDDDDGIEPSHIQLLAESLSQHQDSIAAYSATICSASPSSPDILKEFNTPFDSTRLLYENYIPIHSLLFRKTALDSPARCQFDETLDLYEDWDFWLQLVQLGDFVHIEDKTAWYRIHPGAGEGVQAEEKKSHAALLQIIEKWKLQWTPKQLSDFFARIRLLDNKVRQQNSHISAIDQELSDNRALLSNQDQQHRQFTQTLTDRIDDLDNQLKDKHQHLLTSNQALEQADQRAQQLSQQLAETEDALSSMREHQQQELAQQQQQIAALEASLDEHRQWRELQENSRGFRMLTFARRQWVRLRFAFHLVKTGQIKYLIWLAVQLLYRLHILQPIITRIPFHWKRSVRNLFSRYQPAPETPTFSGDLPEQIKVSVIIPVYQHAEYIEHCITSAANQTYSNLEVIVVDDCSPDPTVGKILSQWRDSDRVKVLRNPNNLGISETQNRALLESTGEVIAFLDCDDFLTEDAVETCLRYWSKDTVYSHSARINIDTEDKEINRICFKHLPREDYFQENLEAMYATHFKMIRRDAFARLGTFDSRFDTAQDYDFLMRVAAHYPSSSFTYIPHFVYHHRLHSGQATEKLSDRQMASIDTIVKEAKMRRDIQSGIYDRKISIIMLSFGKYRQTLEALEGLKKTVSINHEIILFDNGSDAETVEFLKTHVENRFENLQVYYNDRNLGPAAGRREALKLATGEWFLIFDNDEIPEPGWLEELLVRAESDSNIGIVTCKVIFPNNELQCCGGYVQDLEENLIDLQLYARGKNTYDLNTAVFRDCDWCPIGATLFTRNPAEFLHDGYPNIFEDAGVSFAFRKQGLRLVNSPASWVWHEHVTFRKQVEMGERYNKERYDPQRMLLSVASFYHENEKIIFDEYVWRENRLDRKNLSAVEKALIERRQHASTT